MFLIPSFRLFSSSYFSFLVFEVLKLLMNVFSRRLIEPLDRKNNGRKSKRCDKVPIVIRFSYYNRTCLLRNRRGCSQGNQKTETKREPAERINNVVVTRKIVRPFSFRKTIPINKRSFVIKKHFLSSYKLPIFNLK